MGYFMDSFGGYSMCTRCTKNTYAPFVIDNDMMMGKKEKLNITTFNISFALINYLLFCIDLYSKYKYNNFGIIIITYYETLQSIYYNNYSIYNWHLYRYFSTHFELMIITTNAWFNKITLHAGNWWCTVTLQLKIWFKSSWLNRSEEEIW